MATFVVVKHTVKKIYREIIKQYNASSTCNDNNTSSSAPTQNKNTTRSHNIYHCTSSHRRSSSWSGGVVKWWWLVQLYGLPFNRLTLLVCAFLFRCINYLFLWIIMLLFLFSACNIINYYHINIICDESFCDQFASFFGGHNEHRTDQNKSHLRNDRVISTYPKWLSHHQSVIFWME